jgi:GNAT superfamily N-acetyltransferase
MTLDIRRARQEDAGALAVLLRELDLFGHVRAEQPEQTAARVERHVALCLADHSHSLYVAERPGGEIVGYLAAHWLPYLILRGPEGYISELFLAAGARGQGLGRRLLEAVVQEARVRGCARLQLINMRSRESYERAFYQKAGWQERPDAADFVLVLE